MWSHSYWQMGLGFELKKFGFEVHCWNSYIMLPSWKYLTLNCFIQEKLRSQYGKSLFARKKELKVRLMNKTYSSLLLVHVWGPQDCFRCQTLQVFASQPFSYFGDTISTKAHQTLSKFVPGYIYSQTNISLYRFFKSSLKV